MSDTTSPPAPVPAPAGATALRATGPIPPYFGPVGRSAPDPGPRSAGSPAASDATGTPGGEPGHVPPPEPGSRAPEPAPTGPVAAWALSDGPAPTGGPDDGSGGAPGPAAPAAAGPPSTVPQVEVHPTTPVTSRPTVRARRRDPMTRMGPWAPVAGALLGLVIGLVVVLILAGRADAFREGLALAFLVVGLTMLGAAGALLGDEVRLVRRGAREAAVRPAWVEATAGLLNGLTPARLLLSASAFVLFLAAYVAR